MLFAAPSKTAARMTRYCSGTSSVSRLAQGALLMLIATARAGAFQRCTMVRSASLQRRAHALGSVKVVVVFSLSFAFMSFQTLGACSVIRRENPLHQLCKQFPCQLDSRLFQGLLAVSLLATDVRVTFVCHSCHVADFRVTTNFVCTWIAQRTKQLLRNN